MPRPKSDDPKRAVTLRLRSSVLARYEAMGGSWRAKMEAVLEAHGVVVKPAEAASVPSPTAAPPRKHVNRLKGVWKAP